MTKPPFILFAHSAYRLGEAYEARQGDCPHVHAWSKTDLLPRLGEADVLCLSGFWENNLIDKIPNVRFIQLCSAGYDHFDVAALKARGIRMANAAGANANAVSEHAFALLLAITRRMTEARDNQQTRRWRDMISDPSQPEDDLSLPDDDASGTGHNNRFKYIAGLNPTDPSARFQIDARPAAGAQGHAQVVFSPRMEGRQYRIFKAEALLPSPVWTEMTPSAVTDVGSERRALDPEPADTQQFYRIEITLP